MRLYLYEQIRNIADDYPDTSAREQIIQGIKEFLNADCGLEHDGKDNHISNLFHFLRMVLSHNDSKIIKHLKEMVFDAFSADPSADFLIPRFVLALSGLTDFILLDPDTNLKLRHMKMNIFDPLLGLPDIIYAYAKKDIPILICGETGTSKGLLAKAIFEMGHRRNMPYREINCAAMPEALIESELFGYKKGAVTSPLNKDMHGILHNVNGGTLLLDEIGKMPTHNQVKLLKAMEDDEFYPIGSDKPEKIDIRFIAATQPQQLEKIYPDLLWRLGYPDMIQCPPLRERLKIIPEEVIESSLKRVFKKLKLDGRPTLPYITPVKSAIENHEFPGNYRELENIIRRAVILNDLTGSDLDHYLRTSVANDVMSINKADTNLEKSPDHPYGSIHDIPLKDILDHADRVRRSIVEAKLQEALKSGKKIKNVLMEEGLTDKNYQNYYGRIRRITKKGLREL